MGFLISGGYILLSRKIIESEIWLKPPLYLKVWLYLLSKAQHTNYRNLEAGQLVTSIPEIINDCSWYSGFRKESPSKDQIYQILDWMRKASNGINSRAGDGSNDGADTGATMIATTRATQHLLVNIVKYKVYQNPKNYGSNDDSNDGKEMGATREQRLPSNINKNVKNDKNDKKKSTYTENPSKKKYGEYGNVLLKDEELEKLRKEYPNHEELIKHLDEYMEMKDYKVKSAYLAIKKWVVKAVIEQHEREKHPANNINSKPTPAYADFEQRDYSDLDMKKYYANLKD